MLDLVQRGMRGPMSERRVAMVDLAFNVLDRTGDGRVNIDDLMDSYDVSWHPGVKNGSLTKEQALREFLNQWDRGERDGVVTREEFHEYMQDVSASIDSDTYFELVGEPVGFLAHTMQSSRRMYQDTCSLQMVRNAYRITGGEDQAANTANLRVLVTHADGRQVS
jgi:hypothetical protein